MVSTDLMAPSERISMDPEAREAVRMLNRLYARLVGRRPSFQTHTDYALGKQPLNFATEEWKKANAQRYTGFSDNWCGPVVSAEAERIAHTGIVLKDDADKKLGGKLWDQWLLNEGDMQSSAGFLSTLITSRTFILVWGTPDDEPLMTWETGESAEVEYDWFNPRKRKAGVKTWADEENEFATLYTDDFVWKFQRAIPSQKNDRESQTEQSRVDTGIEGGWSPRAVNNEPWPLPNPMGVVPIVEIPNRPILGRDPISEITGAMSMQDAINLLWAYMFLAADYASMDARIITGTAPPMVPQLDSDGQKIADRPVPMKELYEKRIAFFTGENVKAQSFPKADLSGFLSVIDQGVGHISSQTRTPPTYLVTKIGLSNVNGEGLKASEIGLVRKTLEFQRFVSPALREVYRLFALAMGDKGLAQAARLATIRWANPEIRSEGQLSDMLVKKKAIGYPFEYLMELDGVGPVDIDRVIAMREQEMRDAQLEAAMRGLDDAQDGGGAAEGAAGDSSDDDGDTVETVAAAGV